MSFASSVTLLAYAAAVFSLPAPQGFTITSFVPDGTGCPPGSAYYALNSDRTAVKVNFSKFFARGGPDIPVISRRKYCQLGFGVDVPPGFTYTIASVDYSGYYQLDVNVTSDQQSIYYFNEPFLEATTRSQLVGPIEGKDYTYRDEIESIAPVLAPCGVSSVMNIRSDLRVSNSRNINGSGYIASPTDSIESRFNITFNLQWQKCSL